MSREINIETHSKYNLLIDELEDIKELVEKWENKSVLINKELLLLIINESINDYWRTVEEGERY